VHKYRYIKFHFCAQCDINIIENIQFIIFQRLGTYIHSRASNGDVTAQIYSQDFNNILAWNYNYRIGHSPNTKILAELEVIGAMERNCTKQYNEVF